MSARRATILVVEDEELVREFVEQVLSEAGYEVLLAANADEAVRILAQREIDLLFTDIVMPGSIDGLALARLVYAKYPRTRVLCASGYAPVLESLPAGDPAFAHLLRKPYRGDTVVDEISRLLG
jgi:two-component system, response regulator PdtaR